MTYHNYELNKLFEKFSSGKKGLTARQARINLENHGYNELLKEKEINKWSLLFRQFTDSLIIILIFAAILSFLLREYIDGSIITFIVIANGLLGFFQEFRAEKAVQSLKKMIALNSRVLRDGKELSIEARLLVPGDVIILEEGDKVPADCRIISSNNLQVDESSLTGESVPVNKSEGIIDKDSVIGDRTNMLFSSTNITRGNALALVVETGLKTQVGKIARMISENGFEQTPLQRNLRNFSTKLAVIVLSICFFIFCFQALMTQELFPSFMVALSLAVAAVPQALPAVITICLSLGVKRMVEKNALVRRLPAVETLGSVDTICTDKTGTLTINKMTVDEFVIGLKKTRVDLIHKYRDDKDASLLFKIGAVCNNASISVDKKSLGDPTETALLFSAEKFGLNIKTLKEDYERVEEIPFDSKRKMMSVIVKSSKSLNDNSLLLFSKGAPDVILDLCTHILVDGVRRPIIDKDVNHLKKIQKFMAGDALRVLGFAYKEVDSSHSSLDFSEYGLTFVGLQAMMDPPREEVKVAVKEAKSAGINIIMVTGDYLETAKAVGRLVGIKGEAVEGRDLNLMSDSDLRVLVEKTSIFARVDPEHKLRIVKALKDNGRIVAMTGDGVNDAPALKTADIGVSMGLKGTEVAKEASELILLDDDFGTIVEAVREGRVIYDNIDKFLSFLLYSNFVEMAVVFFGMLINFQAIPFIAIHLLWVNLLTDGLPAIALSVDPPEGNIMKRPPRENKTFITKEFISKNILVSSTVSFAVLLFFYFFFSKYSDLMFAQTVAFTSMVMFEMIILIVVRNKYSLNFFSNKYLTLSLLSTVLLQVLVVYGLGRYFKTIPLPFYIWLWIVLASVVLYFINLFGSRLIDVFVLKKRRHLFSF